MSGDRARIDVLHVDDEPDFLDLTATYLERELDDITVRQATSAAEGLEGLTDGAVDCVVSDYEMPGQDGIDFLESVRQRQPDLPFILFTGKGSEEIASEAISAGVTDYLQKSAGADQYTVLANRITNAVDQHRATQRLRERERELDRQNRRLSALFDNFPEPTFGYVYENDEPRIVSVNEAFADVFGYSPEEAVGEHVDDLIVPPDRREEARRVDERVREGAMMDKVLRRETTDGVRDFRFRNIALQDDDTIDGYAIYVDITEREKRERDLVRYKSIVEASGDPVYTLDAEGRFTFVNDALVEMTGYDENDLLGSHASLVFEGETIELAGDFVRATSTPGTDRGILELDVARQDGQHVPCEARVTPLPYEEEFHGTVGVVRDISDRKHREE